MTPEFVARRILKGRPPRFYAVSVERNGYPGALAKRSTAEQPNPLEGVLCGIGVKSYLHPGHLRFHDGCEAKRKSPFRDQLAEFIYSLVSHYVLDDGKIVVAHAGMKEEMQGRGSGKVREFALYGETTGETDEFGLPIR